MFVEGPEVLAACLASPPCLLTLGFLMGAAYITVNLYVHATSKPRPPEPPSFDLLWKPEHNAYDNVAFIAVYRREWQRIAAWLRAEAVWEYPEPDDMDAMMRGLRRWEAHEFYPMGPERTGEPT
jgi:hypothetical protein